MRGWTTQFDEAMRLNHAPRGSIEGSLWGERKVPPALNRLHMARTWAGMNVNIDGAPLLGKAPGVPGFFSVGLTLASLLKDEETARRIQLIIEYAPEPPFKNNTPAEARPGRVAGARCAKASHDAQALEAANAAGRRLGIKA